MKTTPTPNAIAQQLECLQRNLELLRSLHAAHPDATRNDRFEANLDEANELLDDAIEWLEERLA